MTLWDATEAVEATGGISTGDWVATGVSIDSRTLQPGDLFVALTAGRDGHEFVDQAFAKGAAAALVSRRPPGVAGDARLLLVDNVQTALESLGRFARSRALARVAAITGSAGKTSTKDMLETMLSDQGYTHVSVASYNNHWGVPLTLARLPRDAVYAVVEIGMNRPGEIAPLTGMVRPHVAMVTTVAAAHLAAFGSVEAIAREKASILQGLESGGTAVFNGDIATARILAKGVPARARMIQFGRSTGLPLHLASVTGKGGTHSARASIHGNPVVFTLAASGDHFALNALGALGVAQALGADLHAAIRGLSDWRPKRGRGGRATVPYPGRPDLPVLLIDDSYNANPASMSAALDMLAEAPASGRRIAVLGDMRELGAKTAALHMELADHPGLRKASQVHCVGPAMRALYDALPGSSRGLWVENGSVLAARIDSLLRPGDVVLVKGSNSTGLARVADAIHDIGRAVARSSEQSHGGK